MAYTPKLANLFNEWRKAICAKWVEKGFRAVDCKNSLHDKENNATAIQNDEEGTIRYYFFNAFANHLISDNIDFLKQDGNAPIKIENLPVMHLHLTDYSKIDLPEKDRVFECCYEAYAVTKGLPKMVEFRPSDIVIWGWNGDKWSRCGNDIDAMAWFVKQILNL